SSFLRQPYRGRHQLLHPILVQPSSFAEATAAQRRRYGVSACPMTPPEFWRLPRLAVPNLALRYRVVSAPAQSMRSTSLAACFHFPSIRFWLAQRVADAEGRQTTILH